MNRDSKIDYEKAVLAHPRKLEIAGGGLGDVGRDSLCKTRATSIGGIQSCSTLSWGRGPYALQEDISPYPWHRSMGGPCPLSFLFQSLSHPPDELCFWVQLGTTFKEQNASRVGLLAKI